MTDEESQVCTRLTLDEKKAFYKLCIDKGITMSDRLRDMIRKDLEKPDA